MIYIFLSLTGIVFLFLSIHFLKFSINKFYASKLKLYLSNSTFTSFYAFLSGIVFTALFQSSQAITVITLLLVSTNSLPFKKGLSVILGSNIGTCFSGFLYSLDSNVIPFITLSISVVLYIFKKRNVSLILVILSMLFLSIELIEISFLNFKNSDLLINFFALSLTPTKAILASTLVTAIMQSSSVVVIIIQNLLSSNIISLNTAICFVLGSNIGTCVTGLIVSVYSNKETKIVAFFNMFLNLFGGIITILFLDEFKHLIDLFTLTISNQKLIVSTIHLVYNCIFSILFFVGIEIISFINNKNKQI